MIMYLAAVASALTLAIAPVMASETPQPKPQAQWAKKHVPATTISINHPIEVTGGVSVYVLSPREQGIFRKALLRSVKVVNPGRLV